MAAYALDPFDLTDEQINELGGSTAPINTIAVWDPFPPAGWLAVSIGATGARVVCPKPCGSITLPPPPQ
jgi:hypothetical protein